MKSPQFNITGLWDFRIACPVIQYKKWLVSQAIGKTGLSSADVTRQGDL